MIDLVCVSILFAITLLLSIFKLTDFNVISANISEGKRIRLSRSTSVKCTQNNTTKSSKRKIPKQESPQSVKKRKCLFPEESDPRNVPSTSTGVTRENFFPSPSPASEDSDFE